MPDGKAVDVPRLERKPRVDMGVGGIAESVEVVAPDEDGVAYPVRIVGRVVERQLGRILGGRAALDVVARPVVGMRMRRRQQRLREGVTVGDVRVRGRRGARAAVPDRRRCGRGSQPDRQSGRHGKDAKMRRGAPAAQPLAGRQRHCATPPPMPGRCPSRATQGRPATIRFNTILLRTPAPTLLFKRHAMRIAISGATVTFPGRRIAGACVRAATGRRIAGASHPATARASALTPRRMPHPAPCGAAGHAGGWRAGWRAGGRPALEARGAAHAGATTGGTCMWDHGCARKGAGSPPTHPPVGCAGHPPRPHEKYARHARAGCFPTGSSGCTACPLGPSCTSRPRTGSRQESPPRARPDARTP